MLDMVARSGALALALLIALAVAHKLRTLATRRAADEPLVAAGRWTRSHPATALGVAAAAECCVATALVARPGVGYLATAALLAAYIRRLRLLADGEDCNCFGELLAARSRGAAIARNAAMAVGSLIAGTLVATGAVEPAALSPTVAGLVAVPVAGGLASHMLNRRLGTGHAFRNV